MPDAFRGITEWTIEVAQRAKEIYQQVYAQQLKQNPDDPRKAASEAAESATEAMLKYVAHKALIDPAMKGASTVLASFLAVASAFRKEEVETFDDTMAEVLNEFLLSDYTAADLKTGGSSDAIIGKAKAIGHLVLTRLESEFTANGGVNVADGEKGAETFAGFGVNFAIQNALVSALGACLPEVHLDDLRELGVEVAQNLGLGRLMRLALQPLIKHTIQTPYDRKLAKKYQIDLLGLGELARAHLAKRMDSATVFDYLQQHGLSDPQITELIEQHTPRLNADEFELLRALGEGPETTAPWKDAADGLPQEQQLQRLRILQWKRLHAARERILTAVLAQVAAGFLEPTELDKALTDLGIPTDESDLWRKAAGYLFERTRKRLSHAEMLTLYEAAQITSSEVAEWAKAEGYGDVDVQRILLLFELKATSAAQGKAGSNTVNAAHLHAEHIAFITDEITGLFSRAPSAAELGFWVHLLDTKERTKADVKNELKALDSNGSAIPPK